jgi:hypothetical protein
LVKDATKKLFLLTELKNVWNAGTGALKSRGITLKSNISFVSVYLQYMRFFFLKIPCTFWLTLSYLSEQNERLQNSIAFWMHYANDKCFLILVKTACCLQTDGQTERVTNKCFEIFSPKRYEQ